MSVEDAVRTVSFFGELEEKDAAILTERIVPLELKRGDVLVRQGEDSDSLYVVLSGRFLVYVERRKAPVAEISAGELIGEMGFFSDQPRTATVIAARDAAVGKLTKQAFEEVVAKHPRIYRALLNSLAKRLTVMSARVPSITRRKAARTAAIVFGGQMPVPAGFMHRLREVFERRGKTLFLDRAEIGKRFPDRSPDDPEVARWLNQCENDHELIIYAGDPDAGAWTQKCLRQADQAILVVHGDPKQELNESEKLALRTHEQSHRRLVIVHEKRKPGPAGIVAEGSADWLRLRPVTQHHHVSVEDDADFARLHRFLTGRALGFVAGGGGGYGPAHIGIFKAFAAKGITFDVVGGTSVGASMMAGFAMMRSAERIDDDTKAIFISNKALKRRTLPRYSFLDHKRLDEALIRGTCSVDIEDMWLPYYAMATDLSASGPYVFRNGPLWKALRASGSIPGVLPPFFTDDGRMLVDGGLTDNIPLKQMHSMKAGPNVIVHFGMPRFETYQIDYSAIPGRWPLVARLIFARKKLPNAPGPVRVLRRCLFANNSFDHAMVGPQDTVIEPPPFPGSSFLDFDQHTQVFNASYDWAAKHLDERIEAGDPAIRTLLELSR
jgi:NTE family protein